MDSNNSVDWIKLIDGGFSMMTAPFAVHPHDRDRANEYVKKAKIHGLTVADAIGHAKQYLQSAKGCPCNEDEQIQRVKAFVVGKLPNN